VATQFAGINKQGNGLVVSGWVNPATMVLQATVASDESDGDVVIDSVASSPGQTITGTATTGQYSITFPPAKRFHFVGGEVMLAEAAGSKLSLESYDANAGTATFEAAVTPGTAADPAALSRLFITYVLERG
jgi:uncharacterized cupin superfamily protein